MQSWENSFLHVDSLGYPNPIAVGQTGADAKAFAGSAGVGAEHSSINGQLTRRGASQLRSAGRALRKTYPDVFADEDLYIRSTHYPRVVRSMQNLLIGFFGLETDEEGVIVRQKGEKESLIRVVPSCDVGSGDPLTTQWEHPHSKMYAPYMESIFMDTIEEAMRMSNGEQTKGELLTPESRHVKKIKEESGNFRELHREMMKKAEEEIACREVGEDLRKDDNPLFEKVTPGEKTAWKVLKENQALWDEWHCRRHHGRKVPTELTDRHQSNIETAWSAAYDTPEARKLGMGRFLEEIVSHIDTDKHRGVLFAGHDATIMPLLSFFDAFDGRWPVFASSVTFEVLEREGEAAGKFIRMLRNDKPLRLPALEAFAKEKGIDEPYADMAIYPFDTFKLYVKEHSYGDREIDYILHAHSKKADNSS